MTYLSALFTQISVVRWKINNFSSDNFYNDLFPEIGHLGDSSTEKDAVIKDHSVVFCLMVLTYYLHQLEAAENSFMVMKQRSLIFDQVILTT